MKKMNCWEYKKCGNELGGANSGKQGVCPCAMEARLNGAHQGKWAGRACWVVPKTLCNGARQGSFGDKYGICVKCGFYLQVRQEEGVHYILPPVLLNRLNTIPELLRAMGSFGSK
jgi:hypothetical protein